jgi:hypothetical protein
MNWRTVGEIRGPKRKAVPFSKESMQLLLERVLVYLVSGVICCALAAQLCPVAAVTAPPESAPTEKEPAPPQIAPARERDAQPENPFRKSANPDAYEQVRQKREKRTIIIILTVVVLLCAYWLTSGRLHHRLPRQE